MLQYVIHTSAGRLSPDRCARQTKFRSHIIYCDTDLNTDHTVYLNIYQNFILTAMKIHQYIRNWGISTTKSSNFIQSNSLPTSPWPSYWSSLDSVRQVIRYAYTTIRNKATNKVARVSAGKCEIQKDHVIWCVVRLCMASETRYQQWNWPTDDRLGTHAFHAVLSRKAPNYRSLLKHLTFELSLPRYKRSRKRFRALVKEGLASMAHISFWLPPNTFCWPLSRSKGIATVSLEI